jgi:hypothetical protein
LVRQRRAGPATGDDRIKAQTTPDYKAVRGLFRIPIKAAPLIRNIHQESEALLATLGIAQALASRRLLPTMQKLTKTEMPTIYTSNDFVLIMLHQPSAGTISVLVTTQERVGRTMKPEPAKPVLRS